MEITEKQKYDLNNRNVASQSVQLGDIIKEEGGETLTYDQVEACDNDTIATQEVRLGHILKAICAGDTSHIPDLTEEQIDRLNNIDVACQNAQLGTLIQAILDGTQKFELTLECDVNMGTVSGAGKYVEGASVVITATPNYGYKFIEWQGEQGETLSTDTEYTFNMPANSLIYTAVFEALPTYTLTVNSNDDTLGSVMGGGNYVEGEQVELTATPLSGDIEFVNWTINGVEISTDNPFIYTTTATNITITGNFSAGAAIYGVSGLYASEPTLHRTDDAVGMTYSIDSTTGQVSSDFNNVFPFNQFIEETDSHGNIFINIPSMWFRIGTAGNIITDIAVSSKRGLGNNWYQTKAFKYGKYGASSDGSVLKSVSGVNRKYSITRADARTQAMAVGTGYHQRDLYAGTVLSFLWLIEFATKNSQSIMPGCGTGEMTGDTNSIVTPTGYVLSTGQMKWHGIEDFIGNGFEFEDGSTGTGTAGDVQYVSADYTKYNDTGVNMDTLSFNAPTTPGNCLTALGWDSNHPFLVQPYETTNDANYVTYYCDYVSKTNNIISYRGSSNPSSAVVGVFNFGRYAVSRSEDYLGCRLLLDA